MTKLITKITILACTSTLAACSFEGGQSGVSPLLTEAGKVSKTFGDTTANNIAVMNGELQQEMVKNLTRLFAAEAPATINFEFNSSKLDASAQAALRRQAEWIKAHPNITFRVFGHTDKVGSDAYNRRLGLRRAKNAVNYLIQQGVDRKKVEAVVSLGETQPLVLTESENRENRRTVTEVKGFVPPVDLNTGIDGKYAVRIYNEYTQTNQSVEIVSATQ